MAKVFEKIIEANKKKDEEQRRREERLKELEEAQNRPGLHFPNPIQIIKDKKEMKELRKEIAEYKEKRRRKWTLIGLGCCMLVLFIFVGIMATLEKAKEDAKVDALPTDTIIATETSTAAKTEATVDNMTSSGTLQSSTAESTIGNDNVIESHTSTTTVTESTETTMAWDGLVLTVSDLSVNTLTDYAHTNTEVIFLGNDEGVTITITAPIAGVTVEDLVIVYDDALLGVKISESIPSSDRTVIELYVTGKSSCDTEMAICTAYDIATLGDEATGYLFDIRKLDYTEGRVVYVTSSGEKYHYSESCAGDNATKTT